eukprot:scaffold261243_cov28-Tisochrysis_lutea.AAC.1
MDAVDTEAKRPKTTKHVLPCHDNSLGTFSISPRPCCHNGPRPPVEVWHGEHKSDGRHEVCDPTAVGDVVLLFVVYRRWPRYSAKPKSFFYAMRAKATPNDKRTSTGEHKPNPCVLAREKARVLFFGIWWLIPRVLFFGIGWLMPRSSWAVGLSGLWGVADTARWQCTCGGCNTEQSQR